MTDPIARFELPLSVCPTANVWGTASGAAGWARAHVKRNCWEIMLRQYMRQFGRMPYSRYNPAGVVFEAGDVSRRVVCTRYSSMQPDKYSGWSKVPVDLLQVPRRNRQRGLGLIWDDSPRHTDVEERWEYAPRKTGKVIVEVFE